MFRVGDAVVHPVRGAGMVIGIEERQQQGSSTLYYRIELLGQPTVRLMLPISSAQIVGLRLAVPLSELKQVWQVLRSSPQILPGDNNERYRFVRDKLRAGDVFQVAEVVRDMASRQQVARGLTTVGKRLYDEGLMLLAAEVAAVQGNRVADAATQIRDKLSEGPSPSITM